MQGCYVLACSASWALERVWKLSLESSPGSRIYCLLWSVNYLSDCWTKKCQAAKIYLPLITTVRTTEEQHFCWLCTPERDCIPQHIIQWWIQPVSPQVKLHPLTNSDMLLNTHTNEVMKETLFSRWLLLICDINRDGMWENSIHHDELV